MLSSKKKAYTLLELLVVILIIGILTVFAVPTYKHYSDSSVFNQEAEEVKGLVEDIYNMAKNPEPGAKEYIFTPYTDGVTTNRFTLSRKNADDSYTTLKEVIITSGEGITCSTIGNSIDDTTCASIHCSTDYSVLTSSDKCPYYHSKGNENPSDDDQLISPPPIYVTMDVNNSSINKKFTIDQNNIRTSGAKINISTYSP